MADIVIGVDESQGAAEALRWAVREAELRGWTVRAVLAWGLLDQHHADGSQRFDPAYDSADALAALDAAVVAAVGPETARTVERSAVCDLPARALLTAAADARLLVVGARGLGGFQRLLLGSVSDQCLHHARCPVAVIHAGQAATDRPVHDRVVVGVDDSDHARRALRWAIGEARARGSALRVVHAWMPPAFAAYPYGAVVEGPDVFGADARDMVTSVLESEDLSGLAGPLERAVVCDRPAAALLDAAKEADLVVVGSRGAGGFPGLRLGSVSQQVARHSPSPVVVVRDGEAADEADEAEAGT